MTGGEYKRVWDFAVAPPRIAPGVMSMLGSYQPGAQWCREPGTAGGYMVTADPAGLYERVRARGADIIRPLTQPGYDANEFAVRDPEGNLWSFGDYRGEPLPGRP